MDAELWERVQALLTRALELPAGERAAFVAREASGDELREEVLSLLEARTAADGFFGDLREREEIPGAGEPFEGATGQRVGHWTLEEFLGRGGMGAVYRARRSDGEFDQEVAIKLLSLGANDPEAHRRFLAEREILARQQHPGSQRCTTAAFTPTGRPTSSWSTWRASPSTNTATRAASA